MQLTPIIMTHKERREGTLPTDLRLGAESQRRPTESSAEKQEVMWRIYEAFVNATTLLLHRQPSAEYDPINAPDREYEAWSTESIRALKDLVQLALDGHGIPRSDYTRCVDFDQPHQREIHQRVQDRTNARLGDVS